MKTFSSQLVLDRFKQANNLSTDTELAEFIGVKKATLSNWRSRNSIDWNLLFSFCEQLNIDWLVTGNGEMLKTKRMFSESPDRVNEGDEVVYLRKGNNFHPVSQVAEPDSYVTKPRIPFEAAAGSLSLFTDSVSDEECERLPVIPIFPAYDFTIFVKGDSMLPDIKSGDELACRFVREAAAIKWGETYVLDTTDGVVVKNVHRGPGSSIICRSLNPRFEDFSVDRSEILRMARVVGLVRHL